MTEAARQTIEDIEKTRKGQAMEIARDKSLYNISLQLELWSRVLSARVRMEQEKRRDDPTVVICCEAFLEAIKHEDITTIINGTQMLHDICEASDIVREQEEKK